MILNSSKRVVRTLKVNTTVVVMSICSILFIGCRDLYVYQPADPIYNNRTNPNEDSAQSEIEKIPLNKQSVSSEAANQRSIDNTILETKQTPVFVKKPLSPAVVALMSEADNNSKAGDLDSAVSTIERALRIDPRNPTLTYKLAALRLKQSKPRLAEDLAKKAALLSAKDTQLKKKSWLLISEARKKQKNFYGAKEALLKAEQF